MALQCFEHSQVDLMLSGHLHIYHSEIMAPETGGRALVAAQAGTTLSERLVAGYANSFNSVELDRNGIRIRICVARRTVGIGDVENLLQVSPDAAGGGRAVDIAAAGSVEPVSDDWITTRVTASLRLDRAVDADGIDVSANDGILTLSGTVPTTAQEREAVAVAGAINGVRRVKIYLVVDESERSMSESAACRRAPVLRAGDGLGRPLGRTARRPGRMAAADDISSRWPFCSAASAPSIRTGA